MSTERKEKREGRPHSQRNERSASGRPRRKWRRRLVAASLVLIALVAAAPTIVSWTPLRNVILNSALSDEQGTLTTRGASFGWFSRGELVGVQWKDAEGRPMVRAERIALDRSLWQLLSQSAHLGEILIEKPELEVRLRADGSNLEDALAPWLTPSEEPRPLDVTIRVNEGQVTIHDTRSRVWRVDDLSVRFRSTGAGPTAHRQLDLALRAGQADAPPAKARTVALSADEEQRQVGAGQLRLKWSPGETGGQQVRFQAHAIPLAMAESLIARFAPRLELSGELSGDLTATWTDDLAIGRVLGKASGRQLAIHSPALGADRIVIEKLDAPCEVELADRQVLIKKLAAVCELGELNVTGQAPLIRRAAQEGATKRKAVDTRSNEGSDFGSSAAADSVDWAATLARWRGTASAQLDLARLAALAPHVLRVREDTTLTSGTLFVSLGGSSSPNSSGASSSAAGSSGATLRRWQAELSTRDLRANVAGRVVVWEQPIAVTAVVRTEGNPASTGSRRTGAGFGRLTVERLQCRSDFLQLDGAGTTEKFDATVQYNLDQLAQRLGQFMDLSEWQIAGQGGGRLNWSLDAQRRFVLAADLNAESFRLTGPGRPAWHEPSLRIEANASGRLGQTLESPGDWNARTIERLDAATISLRAAEDVFEVRYVPSASDDARQTARAAYTAGANQTASGSAPSERLVSLPGRAEPGAAVQGATSAPGEPGASAVGETWPLNVTLKGELARWRPRLAVFLPLETVGLGGQLDAAARVEVSADDGAVRVKRLDATVENLVAQSLTFSVSEPRVTLAGRDAMWSPSGGKFELAQANLTTSALSADLRNVSFAPTAAGVPQLSGAFTANTQLDQLSRWLQTPGEPPRYWSVGTVQGGGKFDFDLEQAKLNVELDASGQNLALWRLGQPGPGPNGRVGDKIVWQEPTPTLVCRIAYDREKDTLEVRRAELNSQTAQLNVTGSVQSVSAQQRLDLRGSFDYDLALFTPLLAATIGPGVSLEGKDRATIHVRGPLAQASSSPTASSPTDAASAPAAPHWSQQLEADATFAWQKADVYGMPVGPARVAARMHEGRVDFEPLDVAVLDGRLTLRPTIYLAPEAVLVLPAGPIVQNVHVTPEVTNKLLKFIVPVMDDPNAKGKFFEQLGQEAARNATKEGRFSIQLAGARVPLANPAAATVEGTLSIHEVRVTPGPIIQELILIMKSFAALAKDGSTPNAQAGVDPRKSLMSIDDRDVPFRMADGRVYHRDLSLQVDQMTVTSSGSVGLDQTLDLLVELKLPEQWTTGGPIRDALNLKGKPIQIPIRGTFAKREIDTRALGLNREAIEGAAINAGVNALQKLLERRQERRENP